MISLVFARDLHATKQPRDTKSLISKLHTIQARQNDLPRSSQFKKTTFQFDKLYYDAVFYFDAAWDLVSTFKYLLTY